MLILGGGSSVRNKIDHDEVESLIYTSSGLHESRNCVQLTWTLMILIRMKVSCLVGCSEERPDSIDVVTICTRLRSTTPLQGYAFFHGQYAPRRSKQSWGTWCVYDSTGVSRRDPGPSHVNISPGVFNAPEKFALTRDHCNAHL